MDAATYLRTLRAELADLPAARREAALDDVRALLDDAATEGRPVDRVLAELGPAARYREELGLPPLDDPAPRRAAVVLQVAAVATSLYGAFFAMSWAVLRALPWEAGTGQPQVDDLPSHLYPDSTQAVLPAVLVLVVALTSLALSHRSRPGTTDGWRASELVALGGSVLVAAVSAADLGGSGWLTVPAVVLLVASALVPRRIRRRRRSGARGTTAARRWGRALTVAVPGALALGAILSQGYPGDPHGVWTPVTELAVPLAMLAAAVLVGLGSRVANAAVVVVGAFAMVVGLVEGSLLVLAVWWFGGLWVLVGLLGLLDGTRWTPRRRSDGPGHGSDLLSTAPAG